jgi:hypothetical protein
VARKLKTIGAAAFVGVAILFLLAVVYMHAEFPKSENAELAECLEHVQNEMDEQEVDAIFRNFGSRRVDEERVRTMDGQTLFRVSSYFKIYERGGKEGDYFGEVFFDYFGKVVGKQAGYWWK